MGPKIFQLYYIGSSASKIFRSREIGAYVGPIILSVLSLTHNSLFPIFPEKVRFYRCIRSVQGNIKYMIFYNTLLLCLTIDHQ